MLVEGSSSFVNSKFSFESTFLPQKMIELDVINWRSSLLVDNLGINWTRFLVSCKIRIKLELIVANKQRRVGPVQLGSQHCNASPPRSVIQSIGSSDQLSWFSAMCYSPLCRDCAMTSNYWTNIKLIWSRDAAAASWQLRWRHPRPLIQTASAILFDMFIALQNITMHSIFEEFSDIRHSFICFDLDFQSTKNTPSQG